MQIQHDFSKSSSAVYVLQGGQVTIEAGTFEAEKDDNSYAPGWHYVLNQGQTQGQPIGTITVKGSAVHT